MLLVLLAVVLIVVFLLQKLAWPICVIGCLAIVAYTAYKLMKD